MFKFFNNCIFCGAKLPDSISGEGEHVIPKNIYGFWHIYDICEKCKGFFGNCSKITGACSNIIGDCTNLEGDVSGLKGNISNITGNCSGLYGDCTKLSGDVSEYKGHSSEFIKIDSKQLSDKEEILIKFNEIKKIMNDILKKII